MTPLAHKIMMDQCQRVKDRKFQDNAGVLPLMQDVHCFEISQVRRIAFDLGKESWRSVQFVDEQRFLPAPRTWVEWKNEGGQREGMLLHETKAGNFVGVNVIDAFDMFGSTLLKVTFDVTSLSREEVITGDFPGANILCEDTTSIRKHVASISAMMLGAIAIINTPRIIGRVQHMPHRGLERALLKNQKLVGKFPLHAWTEIKLQVTPPEEADGEYEAHLTGERALHFCRAHLRIRLGRLEFVKAHWRGNAAIGIRQSRYVVQP